MNACSQLLYAIILRVIMSNLRLLLVPALVCFAAHGHAGKNPINPVGTSEAFQAASASVEALEQRLQNMQLAKEKSLKSHKAKYEASLRSKRVANVKLAIQNRQIAKVARTWQTRNAELRKTAQEMSHDVKLWQDDWDGVQLNISMAIEMSAAMLKQFNFSEAPELQILQELDSEQAQQDALDEHVGRLRDVMEPAGGLHAAFMQTSARRKRPSIFQALDEGMTALSEEQKHKEGTLLGHFSHLFQLENQRHENLLLEQTRLNATCKSMADLHVRLTLAIHHLEGLNGHLAHRGKALRAFVGGLGERPLPGEEQLAKTDHAEKVVVQDESPLPESEFEALIAEPGSPNPLPSVSLVGSVDHVASHAAPKAMTGPIEERASGVTPSQTTDQSSTRPSWLEWWLR